MKKISSQFKYPKLLIFLFSLIIAYLIFYGRNFAPIHNFLSSLGNLGFFLAGILYAYGFTATPATAILLSIAKEQNIFLDAFIAGLGALMGDLIIFLLVKYEFKTEIKSIFKEKLVKFVEREEEIIFGRFHRYVSIFLACIFVSSPLPSEIGITILSTVKNMSIKKFMLIAYLLHFTGILIILWIGNVI